MTAPVLTAPRINHWSASLRRQFGGRVQRVALDAGLTCPNLDGTRARGGCNFCDASGSFAPYGQPQLPLREQLRRGIEHQRRRFHCERFIAHLQAHTNTHAPLEQLKQLYAECLDHPQVAGLAIGTRPDCLPDEVLDLLATLNREKTIWLEIGLQSVNEETLRWMNRAHTVAEWEDAVERAKVRGLHVSTHLMLGCPGDTLEHWREAAALVARCGIDGVKFHMLYITRLSRLARQFEHAPFPLLTREEYVSAVCDLLELLPPGVEIMRLVSECPAEELIAPEWLLGKRATLNAIENELERRGSFQGSRA